MKTLSREALTGAETFIRDHGRPLEQRLLDFHFNGGHREAVINALADYQNPDGGFGRALEPDIQMEGSSARTTTVGFQVLREVNAPGDHPVVRSAICHLLDTYDEVEEVWPIVPSGVDDAPHAPWWNFDCTHEGFRGFQLNPTAEALAYLHDYASDVPDDLISHLTGTVLDRADEAPDAMEMHDLQCCIRLADTPSLTEDAKERLVKKLTTAARVEVSCEPSEWGGYTLTPLGVVFGPDSCLAAQYRESVELNLDWEIDQQGEDGALSPPWVWGQYEESWPAVRAQWQSMLTMNMLRLLRDFGRPNLSLILTSSSQMASLKPPRIL